MSGGFLGPKLSGFTSHGVVMAVPANDVCVLDAHDCFRFALANFFVGETLMCFFSSLPVLDVAVYFIRLCANHKF